MADKEKEKGKKDDKGKKEGKFFKLKKNIAGKVATSGLGKEMLKKVLDDNTNKMMKALKQLIAKRYSKEKAEQIQDSIIKLMIKGQFQIQKKALAPESFMPADKPLRKAFKRLVKLNSPECDKEGDERKEAFEKVEHHLKKVGKVAAVSLAPYLSHKNKVMLTETMNFLANREFLMETWDDPKCKEPRDLLCAILANYSAPQIQLESVMDEGGGGGGE